MREHLQRLAAKGFCSGCGKREPKYPYKTCTVCMRYWTTGRMIGAPRRLVADLGGWFYIMQCLVPAVVKIGVTAVSVTDRRTEHSRTWGAPMIVVHAEWVKEPLLLERYVCDQFASRRVWRREWFAIDTLPNLVQLVKYTNLGTPQGSAEHLGVAQRT